VALAMWVVPNHHFDISRVSGGSAVGGIEHLNVLPRFKNGNLKEVERDNSE
jgi:hypothetical protein